MVAAIQSSYEWNAGILEWVYIEFIEATKRCGIASIIIIKIDAERGKCTGMYYVYMIVRWVCIIVALF